MNMYTFHKSIRRSNLPKSGSVCSLPGKSQPQCARPCSLSVYFSIRALFLSSVPASFLSYCVCFFQNPPPLQLPPPLSLSLISREIAGKDRGFMRSGPSSNGEKSWRAEIVVERIDVWLWIVDRYSCTEGNSQICCVLNVYIALIIKSIIGDQVRLRGKTGQIFFR